jgi:hypothetical protein
MDDNLTAVSYVGPERFHVAMTRNTIRRRRSNMLAQHRRRRAVTPSSENVADAVPEPSGKRAICDAG